MWGTFFTQMLKIKSVQGSSSSCGPFSQEDKIRYCKYRWGVGGGGGGGDGTTQSPPFSGSEDKSVELLGSDSGTPKAGAHNEPGTSYGDSAVSGRVECWMAVLWWAFQPHGVQAGDRVGLHSPRALPESNPGPQQPVLTTAECMGQNADFSWDLLWGPHHWVMCSWANFKFQHKCYLCLEAPPPSNAHSLCHWSPKSWHTFCQHQ